MTLQRSGCNLSITTKNNNPETTNVMQIISTKGGVIFENPLPTTITTRELLEAAVKAFADLRGANLRDTNLRDTNLRDTNLQGTNLQGADLQGANLQGADLQGANLQGADLRGANLRGTNLQGTNLRGTNLQGADLQGADLQGADLQGANLQGADLRGANLRGTNLRGTFGNGVDLKTIQAGHWDVVYTADNMQIGCQNHEIQEWWKFTDDKIHAMDVNALKWWRVWKPILQQIIEVSPAAPTKGTAQ